MSSIEHHHDCWKCGNQYTCWCTAPELNDDRACPTCHEQYVRIRDATRTHSTKLKYPGAQRRGWRRW